MPDLFLAEPVGNCTDIMATVVLPLRRHYGDQLRVAPFTVLADCGRILNALTPGGQRRGFSKDVTYIHFVEASRERAHIGKPARRGGPGVSSGDSREGCGGPTRLLEP